ncbi:calcium-binding protein [Mesorhizobium sp. AaZ16]|uniref:calcium-binding protein n=1 Tax=Mesorhizobium sp. AaZ16 TaxID=3402289 RepID=UPI00374EB152
MTVTSTYSHLATKNEFQANSFEPGDQLLPDVTGLSNGGFAVAYNNGDIADGEALVDFYDAAHSRIGTFKIPHDGDSKALGQPQVVELDNGNILVAWRSDEYTDAGVRGHLFTAGGEPIGGEIHITGGSANGVDADIQVAALEDGGFVVTHTMLGNVYQARYGNDGVGVDSGPFQVNSALPGDQADSAVAALSTGGYVVTYTDTYPADQTIRARIYNADGSTQVDDFIVGSIGDNTQSKVVGLANGKWAVVYTDTGSGGVDSGNSGITLQIFNGDGENITPDTYIRVNTPSLQPEIEPDIAVLENGFIVVSWTKQFNATDSDIKARVFTPEGVAVTEEFSVTGSSDMDVKSAVAGLLSGQFVTAWQDNTTDGDGGQITAEVTEIVRTTTGDGASDFFGGDELRDIVHGLGGQDDLHSGGGNDELYGGSEDDLLIGGNGNDLLNGGTEIDTMYGGTGNDTFIVDNIGDKVFEANGAGTGIDTVRTSVNYSVVAQFVEKMVLLGTGSINAVGNNLNNTITGNDGNNAIDGRGGADTMTGGLGNDTYYVDNAADKVVEANGAGTGTDTVNSSVTYSAAAQFVENITLTGTAVINATGNNLANTIAGNAANNVLTGALGADAFLFRTGLNGTTNVDTITDFNVVDDIIQLEDFIFTQAGGGGGGGLGTLLAGQFRTNNTGAAQDADDRIIYESDSGKLWYDSNGNAAGGNYLFADLASGLALTNADFFIV